MCEERWGRGVRSEKWDFGVFMSHHFLWSDREVDTRSTACIHKTHKQEEKGRRRAASNRHKIRGRAFDCGQCCLVDGRRHPLPFRAEGVLDKMVTTRGIPSFPLFCHVNDVMVMMSYDHIFTEIPLKNMEKEAEKNSFELKLKLKCFKISVRLSVFLGTEEPTHLPTQ